MNTQHQLFFDDIHFTVSYLGTSTTLNPLSFKLLLALHNAQGKTVSIKTLLDTVWEAQSVSPDTLKQRVFVLRKALDKASFSALTIQAVRGEGYRLVVDETAILSEVSALSSARPSTNIINKVRRLLTSAQPIHLVFALFMLVTITAWATYQGISKPGDKVIANNRIALWSNIPLSEMTTTAKTAYTRWTKVLSQSNDGKALQLVKSEQQEEIPLPLQARKDRLALISFFETIEVGNHTVITLSIIEPTTATILRSDSIKDASESAFNELFDSHLSGIQALLSSQKLYLNKQQRDFANDPIWLELRALSNPS